MERKTRFTITMFLSALAVLLPEKIVSQVSVTSKIDPILVQHWAMPTLLNPAATGDIDFIRIRGGARIDFLGSADSPKNFLATADSPFKLFGKRIGAGIVVNSGSYDLFRNLLIGAQGSYKHKIKKGTLSIGIQIGYFHTTFKGSEFVYYNQNGGGGGDMNPGGEAPEGGAGNEGANGGEAGEGGSSSGDTDFDENNFADYPTQDVGAGIFDLGVGVRYEHPYFHVGVSAQHLTNYKTKLSKEGEEPSDTRYMESKLPMTLYFDAGGNIAINNSLITLQPSLLIGSDFKSFEGLVEMRATYNKKVTFGIDYRWNRAAGVVAGLSIKDFYVGYSWEYDYSASPKGSTGNHELVLGYRFKMDMGGKNMFSHRSIRIM